MLPKSLGPDDLRTIAIVVLVVLLLVAFLVVRFIQKMVLRVILIGALVGVLLLSQPAGPRMVVAVACVMLAALGVTLSDRRDR